MELRQYFALLRKWLWLVILAAVLAGGSAYVVSDRRPSTYQATTVLLINQASTTTQDASALLAGERLARTYAQLMTKRPVMDEVISNLNLPISAEALAKKVTVSLVRDTQLISLKVINQDPVVTRDIANMIPVVFSEHNEQMQLTRYKSSKENLQKQLEAVDADILATESSLEALRAQSEPDRLEIDRLEAALLQYSTTYSNLLRSYEEVRVAEAKTLDTVTVVEPAVLPTSPVGPKTATNTLLAAVVGVMLAVGMVLLIEYLDDTIKTPDDVERVTHLPTLGAIVDFRKYKLEGKEGPIAALHPKSAIAEAYRILRTNLEFSTLGMRQSGALLLVTSAQPVEGKTTSLANLGVSLAQAGKRVLLVDTDLRRPLLHEQFQLSNETGLTTLLLEPRTDIQSVIQPTKIEGLRILPSGRLPANPAEALSFPQTAALLEQLRPLADYVLLDSPPVLSMADASILAQKVDGVLMIVEMGKTRTDVFRRAVAALERVKAHVTGIVLNKVVSQPGGYYYDYYYYSSRYSEDQTGGKKRKRRSKQSWRERFFGPRQRSSATSPDGETTQRKGAEPKSAAQAVAHESEITTPGLSPQAEALYTQGMIHYYDREWEQAHECFRQLRQLAPSHPGIDALLSNEDLFLQRARAQSKLPSVSRGAGDVTPEHETEKRSLRSPKASLRWVTLLAVTAVAVALLALVDVGVIPLHMPLGVSTVHHPVERELTMFAADNHQVV